MQITINPEDGDTLFKKAEILRNETVIMVNGIVNERPKDSINKNILTGELELKVKELQILNQIKNNLPFYFISAWITLDIESTLDSVGLTSSFSKKLKKAGISCNVVAGYHHDHIFVPYQERLKAMKILSDMYESQNN